METILGQPVSENVNEVLVQATLLATATSSVLQEETVTEEEEQQEVIERFLFFKIIFILYDFLK